MWTITKKTDYVLINVWSEKKIIKFCFIIGCVPNGWKKRCDSNGKSAWDWEFTRINSIGFVMKWIENPFFIRFGKCFNNYNNDKKFIKKIFFFLLKRKSKTILRKWHFKHWADALFLKRSIINQNQKKNLNHFFFLFLLMSNSNYVCASLFSLCM